ncbi:MAG: hypothetical protein WD847_08395 [Pirellulales bacterium]
MMRIAVLCIFFGAGLLGGATWFDTPVVSRSAPGKEILTVDDKWLNFGVVWEQKDYVVTLPLKNLSDGPLEVRAVISCGCGAFDPQQLTMAPGATERVRVSLDLTRPDPEIDSGLPRDFATLVTFALDEKSPVSFNLRGEVLPHPLSIQPRSVEFGEPLIKDSPWPSRSVRVTSAHPIRSLQAVCDKRIADVRVHRPIPGDYSWEVVVSPSPELPPGPLELRVALDAVFDVPELAGVPPATLDVKGVVETDVYANPRSLHFGLVGVGEVVSEVLSLGSRHDPFEVLGMEPSGGSELSVTPAGELAGGGVSYLVSRRVDEAGLQRGHVRFDVGQGRRRYEVVVPVSWVGKED